MVPFSKGANLRGLFVKTSFIQFFSLSLRRATPIVYTLVPPLGNLLTTYGLYTGYRYLKKSNFLSPLALQVIQKEHNWALLRIEPGNQAVCLVWSISAPAYRTVIFILRNLQQLQPILMQFILLLFVSASWISASFKILHGYRWRFKKTLQFFTIDFQAVRIELWTQALLLLLVSHSPTPVARVLRPSVPVHVLKISSTIWAHSDGKSRNCFGLLKKIYW
jgi:hypothetical protein